MKAVLIPGDGIGKEISQSVVDITKAMNLDIEWVEYQAGAEYAAKTKEVFEPGLVDAIKEYKWALKGPTATPIGTGFRSVNVALRQKFATYANVRPIRSFKGIDSKYENIDLVMIRENTEDLYKGIEYMVGDDVAHGIKLITREASEKICRYAFEYAKANGYDTVTTTLLYSIYQKHDFIKKLMEDLSKEFDIDFLYIDFRKGFWKGHDKAIEQGLYMQKYCGCIFSEEDRYVNCKNTKPTLTEGLEFPKRQRLELKRIENKKDYIDMLLENNISGNAVEKYLQEADVYGLKYGDEIVSLAVLSKIDNKTIELKALVTNQKYKNKGYAEKILKSLCGNYKQKYEKMIVGTTEENIPFYVKQGFDKYEKTIKNLFRKNENLKTNNDDFVFDNLIYYSKKLKKDK